MFRKLDDTIILEKSPVLGESSSSASSNEDRCVSYHVAWFTGMYVWVCMVGLLRPSVILYSELALCQTPSRQAVACKVNIINFSLLLSHIIYTGY